MIRCRYVSSSICEMTFRSEPTLLGNRQMIQRNSHVFFYFWCFCMLECRLYAIRWAFVWFNERHTHSLHPKVKSKYEYMFKKSLKNISQTIDRWCRVKWLCDEFHASHEKCTLCVSAMSNERQLSSVTLATNHLYQARQMI